MAQAKPVRRAELRNHLIDVAADLFDREGFHATGIDRILAEAQLAKMTLYNHFPSKDALIVATVQRRDAAFRAWFAPAVEARSAAPRDRLIGLFEVLGDWCRRPGFAGSYFDKAAAEFAGKDHPVRQAVMQHKSWLFGFIRAQCEQLGQGDPVALAAELFILFEGAVTAAAVTGDRSAARRAGAAAGKIVAAA
jgi:AcrR family transcriptional regulator